MARRPRFVCEETGAADGAPDQSGQSTKAVTNGRVAPDLFTSTEIPTPSERPLKVYAFDPSAGRLVGNFMTTSVRYEPLEPGPIGKRFAVIDYDGTRQKFYKPIDLNDPKLLVGGGLAPTESDPRFHQQMVYAVASETLQRFECALGRRIGWRWTKRSDEAPDMPREARRRLTLLPHAMCQANAFYNPDAHCIMFGYFRATLANPGRNLPGQVVYTCLSHDIIAHETTHAIVDGIRGYFTEPTNIDVPAFHEAFADLAALFLHFSHKEVLLDTLQKTGGRLFDRQLRPEAAGPDGADKPVIQAQLAPDNPLIGLAKQFGEAAGMHGSLRGALGTPPNSADIKSLIEPHARGSILVAAVFDAYFTIYTRRAAVLFRIFRAGGGLVGQADIPGPLADRLAQEASRTADQFFTVCARALDYCPPVDITFGDFLRAILTADLDLHPLDEDGVRDAVMEAFRLRGILPEDAASYSQESLFWPKVARDKDGKSKLPTVKGLQFGDPNGLTHAEKNKNGKVLRKYAATHARLLGFDQKGDIDAPSFHPVFHTGQDGGLYVNMVVELVQTMRVRLDPSTPDDSHDATFPLRNGATLLISQDPPEGDKRPEPRIRFVIAKKYTRDREERARTYYRSSGLAAADKAGDSRFQIDFGLLHAGA